jgi:uncharacterized membrane protein YjgN (DUF898 family)
MAIFRDPIVILLAFLLIVTLGAFFLGILPYPLGVLLLVVLLMMRVRSLRNAANRKESMGR